MQSNNDAMKQRTGSLLDTDGLEICVYRFYLVLWNDGSLVRVAEESHVVAIGVEIVDHLSWPVAVALQLRVD